MLILFQLIEPAVASAPIPYVDTRFAVTGAQSVLPSGRTSEIGIHPQRVVLGAEWFYGPQRLRLGGNLHEEFYDQALESEPQPKLWDAQWSVRASDRFTVQVGRQALTVGRSDAPIQSPSIHPHSLSQLMEQTTFRADGIGARYTTSNILIEPMISSVGQDIDQRHRMLLSSRFSHRTHQHDYNLSLAYKAYSQDPFLVLSLTQNIEMVSFGASAITGADGGQAFWGAEGRLSWTRPMSLPKIESLVFSERTAYLSPTGAVRDLESRLQSDNSLHLIWKSPVDVGISHTLFYPINATIPIVHRYSAQLHISY